MTERKLVTARDLAERTGYSVRFFQDMAGRCDWARQPAGPKGRLFFDLEGFEKWWQATPKKPKEQRKWPRSTKETASGGRKPKGRAARTGNPYIQEMKQKHADALARGSSGSTAKSMEEGSASIPSEKLQTAS